MPVRIVIYYLLDKNNKNKIRVDSPENTGEQF